MTARERQALLDDLARHWPGDEAEAADLARIRDFVSRHATRSTAASRKDT